MIIGISGPIGSGKDTLATYLYEQFRQRLMNDVQVKSFALKLKMIVAMLTGETLNNCLSQEGKNKLIPAFGMTIGQMQQKIGGGLRETCHRDIWAKALLSDYHPKDETEHPGTIDLKWDPKSLPTWIISDLRYPNEAAIIKSLGGILIRLEGDPAQVRANSTRDLNHRSETALNDYLHFDFQYTNEGTLEDLYQFGHKIIKEVGLKK